MTGQRSWGTPNTSPTLPPVPMQYTTSPPQVGYSPPFLAQGHAASVPPPLSLGPVAVPGRRWEELYDSYGNKYWVNTATRQSTNVDPYI